MLRLALALTFSATGLLAQTVVQVPLNYNWNGIAHAGETGQPDAPNGFRAISDRALDFTAGVPNDPLLNRYAVVAVPGVLDMVHLGNRNTVDNGNWPFDAFPDNDDLGVQPSWLPNVNQTGPQSTILATPLPIGLTSTASVLFHVSNGGGSFDVTFVYQSTHTHTSTLTGPDWFGGVYPGRANVDRANPGNNLNLIEQVVDLSADAGETLVEIRFGNRSNAVAGYGIYGVNVEPAATPKLVHQLELNYNWNGIVHAGEDQLPDAPNGYRSIASRGLDFRAGVPNDPLLAEFALVDTAGSLDVVMLGNRNTVDGGARAFDPLPDGDSNGVQPTWLPSVDLTGPQTTTLTAPILLDAASTASFLFQSSGGGAFDVTFALATGSVTTTLVAPDWVGGSYLGCSDTDRAMPGLPLRIERSTIDLSPLAGLVLTGITFGNSSNPNGSCAILAANVSGCLACGNNGGPTWLGGGNGPTIATSSPGALGCPLVWDVAGATPNTLLGFFAAGIGANAQPLGALLPGCAGTVHVVNPFVSGTAVDATGAASFAIGAVTDPAFCGLTLTVQYAEFTAAACPLLLSDALSITIGN
ncbi:MAG: hypothetical protein H6838_05320 [Planctomycetes bacterium]|nr:hypothetical protein [Planctomycetota bacterium]MCB9884890.1 hypothetical protein [Planctomycetota bacterium]